MALLSSRTTASIEASTLAVTRVDMRELFKYKEGDKIYGTHANEHYGMKMYIRDLDKAPKESDYKPIFLDTINEKISDEFDEWGLGA